jgi:hypothetical protein
MSTQTVTSPSALLGRLAWLLIGPMLLLAVAAQIASRGGGWLTPLDLAFVAILAAMLLGRWAEHRSGQGTTLAGDPATPADLRRYLATAALAGLGLWALVNVIGNR